MLWIASLSNAMQVAELERAKREALAKIAEEKALNSVCKYCGSNNVEIGKRCKGCGALRVE